MRVKLTDRFCTTAKAEAQTDYVDETVPGLSLRVTPNGVKTWNLLYKNDGRLHRLGLGRYPEITLATARGKALEHKTTIADGGSPRPKTDDDLQGVWDQFVKREGPKLRSMNDRARLMDGLVLPVLGCRPIGEIKRSEIVRMLDAIEDNSGARTAHLALAYLSRRHWLWKFGEQTMEELERKIDALAARLEAIEQRLADPEAWRAERKAEAEARAVPRPGQTTSTRLTGW
jgi:hypothetical protein